MQLATGAVAEIISAQAVHRQKFPDVGYACSLERLVESQMLLDVWLAGKRVDGYESLVPRTIDGDVASCFAKGQPVR